VPHTCNPSYSGGSDQEDLPQFEASLGKQFSKPYLEKNPSPIERAGGVSQGVGPEFKSQYCKGKKKKRMVREGSRLLELKPLQNSCSARK
jgi:hypothetical protein